VREQVLTKVVGSGSRPFGKPALGWGHRTLMEVPLLLSIRIIGLRKNSVQSSTNKGVTCKVAQTNELGLVLRLTVEGNHGF